MRGKKLGMAVLGGLLLAASLATAETVVTLVPFNGTPESYINKQIEADTLAVGGLQADRVYELQRGEVYLGNAQITVPRGKWLNIRAAAGEGAKPIVYLYETGTGGSPTNPPGYFARANGGNVNWSGFCLVGYYEAEPERVWSVQGNLVDCNGAGSTFILDDMIMSNINGQLVRTGSNTVKVQITNCIFANMGALTTSNLGAGKGIDLREATCDSFILVNNTFVNYQDRAIRHYNFKDPAAGTGLINYGLIEHNTFVNGMGFHGLFSLGNVGPEISIKSNLFVDGFALGEDSTDATRADEWQNTGEKYANGRNRITWIFSAPNETTTWTVSNNYYAISDSGQAFLDDYGFGEADKLSAHINGKLGAAAADAFTKVDLDLGTVPRLMTNMMRWYETPNPDGAGKVKEQTYFDPDLADDYDRRVVEFYRDTLDASYPTASTAYTGGEGGFPVGDLNWFPAKKAQWEQGSVPAPIVVDGQKDAFYEGLTGPDDGYLQIKSYAFNDNGIPSGDADLSAKVWTAWDDTWFYLYEEVMDDTVSSTSTTNSWANDCIEVKIDPVPADSTANSIVSLDMTAQVIEGNTATTSMNALADDVKQYARRIIDGGYALELAVKWGAIDTMGTADEIITPAVGNVFGAAIQNHDNDNSKGTREGTVQWAANLTDAVWNQPKFLGTVEFLEGNKLKYTPHNAVAERSNAVPYDGTPFYMRVDGKKDPFYTQLTGPDDGYLQLRSYAWNDNGIPVDDKDLSAKVWTAWDNDWFYLYEEVKDDTVAGDATNVWEEDGLELKIDPVPTDSVKNSIWSTGFTALGKKTKKVVAADSLSNVPDSLKQWIRTKVTGGYNLELAIKWKAISSGTPVETITPAVDNVFGMAVNQHDNDAHAKRQASVQWAAVLLDAAWNTPKYLGTVKFLENNKLQFIPSNNMTGVTNVVPYDGSDYTRSGVEERSVAPKAFALQQNYPNPFNPTTTITYAVPKASNISLTVYDMMGREVAVLAEGRKAAGFYTVEFDGKNLASGVYFYRLKAGSTVLKQKMVMLK